MADDAKIGYPPNRWLAVGDNIGIYSFLAGLKVAREMSYGRCLTGIEAAQCGLATRHFPEAQLEEETYKIAAQIAEIDPELLMLNKMVVNRVWEMMGIERRWKSLASSTVSATCRTPAEGCAKRSSGGRA